jgi:hypothetical protein
MNAVMKSKPLPPHLGDEQTKLAGHSRALLEAQRANSAARNAIVQHRALGNADAEEAARREIAESGKLIAQLTELVDEDKATIAAIEARDRAACRKEVYTQVRRESAAFKLSLETLDEAVVTFCAALLKCRKQQDALEGAQRSAGVPVDIDSVRTKLMGMLEQRMYCESGGVVGKLNSLRSPEEIAKSQLASFKRAARDHHELVLRAARNVLGISSQEAN